MNKKLKPARVVHPGVILRKEMVARDWNLVRLGEQVKMGLITLSCVMDGYADVTQEIADRLAAGLGTSSELWMNLQKQYDEENSDE